MFRDDAELAGLERARGEGIVRQLFPHLGRQVLLEFSNSQVLGRLVATHTRGRVQIDGKDPIDVSSARRAIVLGVGAHGEPSIIEFPRG